MVVYGHQPSASTQIMTAAGRVCTAIKRLAPEQTGPDGRRPRGRAARAHPGEEDADFVSGGEGLVTLVELVAALKAGAGPVARCRPLLSHGRPAVRDAGPAAGRRPGPEMPGIAWDLLPMDRYRAHNWHCLDGRDRQPYASIYTSLGCPYQCSLLLHPGPVPERRAPAGHAQKRPTAIASGARGRGAGADRRRWSRPMACATSSSPTRCSS